MTFRSPVVAILWETWRVSRAEAAWKLAVGIVGGFTVLTLTAMLAPDGDAARYQRINDDAAAIAMILLVLPHLASWLSLARLNGGRPGFPLYLQYTRPVRTSVIVVLPMLYLTALSWAIYLVSALVLRMPSGHAFPLLSVAAWIAGFTVVALAATWATRNRTIQLLVVMYAATKALTLAVERLTAVELPGGYDWPPRLWPTLFDFPRTDYAWIALFGIVSFGVAVAGVARQRRSDGLAAAGRALEGVVTGTRGGGLPDRLGSVFRVPCPTSSATRAQVWLDLKANGVPVLTVGVALAVAILLVSAVSGPIDAAWNADPDVACPIEECFWVRAMPPLFAPISLLVMLLLGGNAFGIRCRQGRTSISAFEASQACATARVATVKLLVKSISVLAALIAIGVSAWLSMPLLGDGVFIQMWGVPLNSHLSTVNDAVGALTGYEQFSLVVVAAAGVVIWVAGFAVLGALWTRYPRRMNMAGALLLLYGLLLGLLALAAQRGIGPEIPLGAILRATSWAAAAAMVSATVYFLWSVIAERLLTMRQASVAVLASAAFGAAWVAVLGAAGVQLADLSPAGAGWTLSPALLTLMVAALAPWSLSRVRHG